MHLSFLKIKRHLGSVQLAGIHDFSFSFFFVEIITSRDCLCLWSVEGYASLKTNIIQMLV